MQNGGNSGPDQQVEYRKISAAWAVDDDISRFLKCLPNWMNLVAESKRDFGDLPANTPFSPPAAPSPIVESAEKIKERNCRESQVLLGNLGREMKIIDSEVIQDMSHLKVEHPSIDTHVYLSQSKKNSILGYGKHARVFGVVLLFGKKVTEGPSRYRFSETHPPHFIIRFSGKTNGNGHRKAGGYGGHLDSNVTPRNSNELLLSSVAGSSGNFTFALRISQSRSVDKCYHSQSKFSATGRDFPEFT